MTQLLPLIDAIPKIKGRVGPPASKPVLVLGDRGYDSQSHRDALAARGIRSLLARRNTPHGTHLGLLRWVVEQSIALLHQFRRLRTRFDKRADVHESFLTLGCSAICWRRLCGVSGHF